MKTFKVYTYDIVNDIQGVSFITHSDGLAANEFQRRIDSYPGRLLIRPSLIDAGWEAIGDGISIFFEVIEEKD